MSSGNLDPLEKKLKITNRQYINGAPAYAPHLQKAIYSDQSKAIMEKMMKQPHERSRDNSRVGKHRSTFASPISLEVNKTKSGLGYVGGKRNSNDDYDEKHHKYNAQKYQYRK